MAGLRNSIHSFVLVFIHLPLNVPLQKRKKRGKRKISIFWCVRRQCHQHRRPPPPLFFHKKCNSIKKRNSVWFLETPVSLPSLFSRFQKKTNPASSGKGTHKMCAAVGLWGAFRKSGGAARECVERGGCERVREPNVARLEEKLRRTEKKGPAGFLLREAHPGFSLAAINCTFSSRPPLLFRRLLFLFFFLVLPIFASPLVFQNFLTNIFVFSIKILIFSVIVLEIVVFLLLIINKTF